MNKSIVVVLLGLCLAGCVNPSKKYYSVVKFIGTPFEGEPRVIHSSTLAEDIRAKVSQGYVFIGHSDFFTQEQPSERQMKSWGKKMGASLVIYSFEYAGTENGVRNVVVPNPPQTSTTYIHGSIYDNNGGSAYYSGTATTTTPGGYSTYAVPYSVRYFAVHEGYLMSTNKEQANPNLPAWYPH